MRLFRIGPGGAQPLGGWPSSAAEGAPAEGGFLWCDCTIEEAHAWVAGARALTGVTVLEEHLTDATNPQHPSWFDATHDYRVLVFRGLAFPPSRPPEAAGDAMPTRPASFVLLPGLLVTIRPADSRLFTRAHDRLQQQSATGTSQRLPRNPDELMLRLLGEMVDRYLELRQPLTERFDRAQRALLHPRRAFDDWSALLDLSGTLRQLQHLCEEQLDALQEWRDLVLDEGPLAPGADLHDRDALLVRGADVGEHVRRVRTHAERLQDSLESAIQLHFSATAHRTNDAMRTLTAITAIFLPLNLITGIFGMNFEFIPGLHSPVGFWAALLTMGALGAAMWMLFRARRLVDLRRDRASVRQRRRARQPGPPLAANQPAGGPASAPTQPR